MEVELIHHTPLWVCSRAIRRCWSSEDKSDTIYKPDWATDVLLKDYDGYIENDCVFIGEKDKALIHRVGNQNKHSSTLEHLVYTFDIDGISRACLQELARHRHQSLSVKSTRYVLSKELDKEEPFIVQKMLSEEIKKRASRYIVLTGDDEIDTQSIKALENLRQLVRANKSNDKLKYALPECLKTSLVMTINMRSLQSMLGLRLNKSALWEFNQLCIKIVQALPKEHLYLVEDIVKEQINGNERIAELKSLFD